MSKNLSTLAAVLIASIAATSALWPAAAPNTSTLKAGAPTADVDGVEVCMAGLDKTGERDNPEAPHPSVAGPTKRGHSTAVAAATPVMSEPAEPRAVARPACAQSGFFGLGGSGDDRNGGPESGISRTRS